MKKRLIRKRKKGASPSSRSDPDRNSSTLSKVFPVVGVGASAGGLEAFSTLLANLPETTGMAFVFLQHLDPSHNSALEEILSRTTRIPVTQVTEGIEVERERDGAPRVCA